MPVYTFKRLSVKVVHFAFLFSLIFLLFSCAEDKKIEQDASLPPEERVSGDEQAIELAKQVMDAAGGREAWNNTRYIHWNFFGMRELLWDKWEQKVRIDSKSPKIEAIIDLENKKGPIRSDLLNQLDEEEVRKKVYEIWVNDSYWLVLPFKLLDPGVHLSYLGKDSTGQLEQIALTFDSVGVTPNNKYILSINPENNRIANWSYYPNAEDDSPRFTMDWGGYEQFGDIWLATNRGANRSMHNVWVSDSLNSPVMQSLDTPMPSEKPD